MWTGSSECSLAVFLFACTFLIDSDARAAPNGASAFSSAGSAVSSAGAFVGAFGGTGNFPGIQNGHKEIRSYDSTGYFHDNDAGRGTKSYDTPSGHGAGHDHSIKGGGHDYNRNGDGCSKCKWENDDYWERDEPEEEQNEDECDDGDDGQYRPQKPHHHDASGRGHAPGSHPSGVHKQGPTGVYLDDGANAGVKGGRPGGINFPAAAGHAGSDSGFGGTTPKPGTNWNTPFASKPGYSGAAAGPFRTTSWPKANTGTTPDFSLLWRPTSTSGYDSGSFVTTPRPGTNWNTGSGGKPGQEWSTGPDGTPTTGFPSSRKPAPGWNAHDNRPGNFDSTPIPGSNWNTGLSTSTAAPWAGQDRSFGTTPRPGQNWDIASGSKPGQNPWNPNYGATPDSQSDCTQSNLSCNQGKQVPVKVGATPIGPTKSGEYPSAVFPATSHTGSDIPSSYGSPKQDQYGPYGQPGTQTPSGVYAGTGVTSVSASHGRVPDFGKKDHPFGFDKPTYSQVPPDNRPYPSGIDQAYPNTGSDTYGPGNTPDYGKPGHGSGPHNTWPSNVPTTFGNTKGPYEGINSPAAVPGAQGVTKPNYETSTYSWSTPGQIGSGSSSWHGPGGTGPHAGFPTSNTIFSTTKNPFSYGSTPIASGNPYLGTGPNQFGFNIASSGANAGAGAFATSFDSHNTPGIIGTTTPSYGTTHKFRGTSYPGVKGYPGTTPYGTHPNIGNAWPDAGSGTSPNRYPETVGNTWPTGQPGISNEPRGKPGDGSGIAPGRYPGSDGGIWPTGRPGSVSGTTPGYFGTGSGNRPVEQPASGSGTWSDGQSKPAGGSGPGCSSITCASPTGSAAGSSNCGSGNYNCGSSCSEGNYPTVHGPCDGPISGPSGVNKTYYPAGTGDGNVPNLGNTYRPNSPSNNIGAGTYPGTGCGSGDSSCNQVGGTNIPEEPIKWNPANPFLFGTGGSTPSHVSRPWDSGSTVKPLGVGNPFLDSSWSTPKPGYNANDKNVIPLGGENNKPIGQGNPFLDNSKTRGDINVDEGVIPLGGKPEGSNPFIRPESGSNGPSYGRHPVGFPGSEIPQSESHGDRNDGFHPGGTSPQAGSNTGPYPTAGNPQSPLQCKLGIFGCGTPGSGSYAPTKGGKHPEGSFGGIGGSTNAGAGIGSGPVSSPDHFNSAGYPGSAGSNVGSISGAGAYAGSFSNAQPSSFASPKSLPPSDTRGVGNNFGQAYSGSWSSSGAQNVGGSNPWAASGASAFASSSAGSWSGNRPTNVKG
ncbi:collagen alpha-2(I) chain isoform X2 [Ooceraea biroi]|uniref:collagen alpha-2(I) chain isoform X2 n=1 Tax=Ooceraea biroi TaxID=2015173 RepID=UPI0005BE270C|nr:collagen alpha-2(I) chain isoform X2 [Ooceraea biroi]